MIGFALIFVGMLVMIASILYQALKQGGGGKYGGVVVIGPLPIVFGSDSGMVKIAVISAIALMVIALLLMIIPGLLVKRWFSLQ
ncbi:MAG: TIGR00304 family protein [Hyperthermus sp.]|nr:MAG: TIGR00304 family protein [Hyperthermus sp.]